MNSNSLDNSERKQKQASAALRWFNTMCSESEWGLSTSEQLRLLGGIDENEFNRVSELASERQNVKLSEDTFERLGLIVSIYKILKEIAPNSDLQVGVKRFSTPNKNDFFRGVSPKSYLVEAGSVDVMKDVHRHLRGLKDGW